MKTVTIANAHSRYNPTRKMTVELQGGNPHFAYIWINDICYSISTRGKIFQVRRIK